MSKHTRRFGRAERDEAGLATLEWLLIVAAVAGLAALGGRAGGQLCGRDR